MRLIFIPNMLEIWLVKVINPVAVIYPAMSGSDRNTVTNPRWSTPMINYMNTERKMYTIAKKINPFE